MNWNIIFLCAIGSFCAQALSLVELANKPKSEWPDLKSVLYWLQFIVYPSVAGFLAYIYFEEKDHVNKLLALHIGVSAPLIFKTLANSLPKGITQRTD